MQNARARLDSINRRLDSVEGALSRHIDHRETMTEGGRQLLAVAVEILKLTREGLSYRWTRVASVQGSDEDSELMLRDICNDFSTVVRFFTASVLPALDGSDAGLVPVEMEPATRRWASQVQRGGEVNAVLYASSSLNYSIESLSESLETIAQILPRRLQKKARSIGDMVFFRVPAIERDTMSMHCIVLGHELGHLWDWKHRASHLIKTTPYPSEWFSEGIILKPQHVRDSLEYPEQVRRWGSEIVSDIVSVYLLGPAALFSFGELIATLGSWSVDTVTHPAPDRRAAIMLEVLESRGYGQVESLKPALEHYRTETDGALSRPPNKHDSAAFAEEWSGAWLAWKTLEAARHDLQERISDYFEFIEPITIRDFAVVLEAAAKLERGLPCGERMDSSGSLEAVSEAAILNAGWLVRLKGLENLGSVLNLTATDSRQASRISATLEVLLLKSLEVSEYRLMLQRDGLDD